MRGIKGMRRTLAAMRIISSSRRRRKLRRRKRKRKRSLELSRRR
jgi:hypothetical protein